jgi:hypothetical protein
LFGRTLHERRKTITANIGFIAASYHPTPELLLASLIYVLLESLMNARWVRFKSPFLSGTYNNFVRQINAVIGQ